MIIETHSCKERKNEHWNKWFAWHPVILENGNLAWLETIERAYIFCHYFSGFWVYREIKKYE